jgi:hypothetical protein
LNDFDLKGGAVILSNNNSVTSQEPYQIAIQGLCLKSLDQSSS